MRLCFSHSCITSSFLHVCLIKKRDAIVKHSQWKRLRAELSYHQNQFVFYFKQFGHHQNQPSFPNFTASPRIQNERQTAAAPQIQTPRGQPGYWSFRSVCSRRLCMNKKPCSAGTKICNHLKSRSPYLCLPDLHFNSVGLGEAAATLHTKNIH